MLLSVWRSIPPRKPCSTRRPGQNGGSYAAAANSRPAANHAPYRDTSDRRFHAGRRSAPASESGEFSAFVAGVRDDRLNSRKQGSQTGEQASAGATIRHAGRFHAACDRQAQGIDEDVALASLYSLVRIEAANTTAFGCLHRLTIHDDNRRTFRAARTCSSLLVNRSVNAGPHAGVLPGSEVVIDGAPRWKVSGKQTPLAAGPQQIQDCIEHCTQVRRASPPALPCWRQQRVDQRPRRIRKIRQIQICHPPVSRKPFILNG